MASLGLCHLDHRGNCRDFAHAASVAVAPLIFYIVFNLAWNFFLLKAVRWLWIATVGFGVVSIAFNLANGSGTWYENLIGLIGLGLLLLPVTRRFFGTGEPVTAT